jgi:hypothetical protein
LFFFAHNMRYYRVFRDNSMSDSALNKQMMNVLYPDNKSFSYRGRFCKFVVKDGLFTCSLRANANSRQISDIPKWRCVLRRKPSNLSMAIER